MKKTLRGNNYWYHGEQVPYGTKIFAIKSGQEVHFKGAFLKPNGQWYAHLLVFETKKYIEVEFYKIEKYL